MAAILCLHARSARAPLVPRGSWPAAPVLELCGGGSFGGKADVNGALGVGPASIVDNLSGMHS